MSTPPPLSPRVDRLPLGDMLWKRFEAFAHDLIARLPGFANCHLHGTDGQKQRGIDLFADDAAGRRWAFSNKRYREYFPSHAREHIAETTYPAVRYVLLLSGDASTSVRNEIDQYPNWEVWDAADLCQKVRDLRAHNPEAARELVDYHFGSVWRRDFLGLPAVAAFLAPEDFFHELLDPNRLFHHAYDLVGRFSAVEALVRFARSAVRVAILPGRGGIGKTRLLRAAARQIEESGAEPVVRFWVEGVPATAEGLDELPNKPCVVVIDDAHRRDDLPLVLAFARRRPDLKVILATRPFGLDRLRGSLTRAGFDAREVTELPPLGPLSRDEVRELARRALGSDWSNREEVVDRLTRVTGDCPLVTVIGGRLIAERAIAPEFLAQDETFRRAVFDRFADELLGRLSTTFPADLARRVLELLAAITPVPTEGNDAIIRQVGRSVGANTPDVARLVGELERVGVLVRRGNHLRVTPDVFADHLLAVACLTSRNEPTGFADQVFGDFSGLCPAAVLRNLAELDWRVRSSSGAEARLLTGLWDGIARRFETGTASVRLHTLGLISDAAYYQPERVLKLARTVLQSPAAPEPPDEGWHTDADVLERLPKLLQRCSYTLKTLPACLDLLWEIGLREACPGAPEPCQAFRVLGEVAKYEHDKPLAMNAAAARAARRWALTSQAVPHRIAILPLLDPLLTKSGTDSWADGNLFYHLPFLVPAAGVRDTRRDVFAVLREYLDTGNVPLQLRSLASVQDALNGPMPLNGVAVTHKDLESWEPDQLELLELLAGFLATPRPIVVQLRVVEAVQYQAAHGPRPAVRSRAAEVAGLVGDSFEVRLARLLLTRLARWDTWDDDVRGEDGRLAHDLLRTRHRQRHQVVTEELWRRHPEPAAAFAFLDATVRELREVEREVEPCHLLWYLLDVRLTDTVAFAELVLANPTSPLAQCFATCLAHARRANPAATTALARRAVESGHPALAGGAANHYCWDWSDQQPLTDADAEVVRLLVGSPDPAVRTRGLGALHHLARTSPQTAVELAKGVEVGGAAEVGEELARLTDTTQPASLSALRDDDLRALLRKFDDLPRIGHWVCALARRVVTRMPDDVLDLFLRRITRLDGYVSSLDAIPDREIDEVFEPLAGHERETELVRQVRDRVLTAQGFQMSALGHLFRAVSVNFGPQSLAALREWMDTNDPAMVERALSLLGESAPAFLFDQQEFVTYALKRAEACGHECLGRAHSTFRRLAVNIERFGTAGEPFPQDVAQRDRAADALRQLTPGTEAYRLYEAIRSGAEERIRQEAAADEDV